MKTLKYFASLVCSLASLVAWAQPTQPVVLDEVVAKVDDYIILKSEVDQTYLDYLSQGAGGGQRVRCLALNVLVQNKVMYVQAEIDSVMADPITVETNLDRRFDMMLRQVGGEDRLQEYFGKSSDELRDELREKVREQLTVQMMRQEIVGDISVTPKEVKKFFESIPRDSIPILSKSVEVAQLVKVPEVSRDEKARTRSRMLDIRQQILDGDITFAEAAKKFSADPGSGQAGGELGWQDRGNLVPEYEAAAFNMQEGEISDPVYSQFGYHLIQLIERRGNRYNSRHILMRVGSGRLDVDNAKHFLDSLRTRILQDSITFEKAAKEHSADNFTASSGGFFTHPETGSTYVPTDMLEGSEFFAIDTMQAGTISGPVPYQMQDGTEAQRIIFYRDAKPAHRANLDDDFEYIQTIAQRRQQEAVLREWFLGAIDDVYIQVDEAYQGCPMFEDL